MLNGVAFGNLMANCEIRYKPCLQEENKLWIYPLLLKTSIIRFVTY